MKAKLEIVNANQDSEQPVSHKSTGKRKYNAESDFSIFEATSKKLGVNNQELMIRLGYARYSFGAWEIAGKMPKVAALACEGLIRRQGKAQQIIIRANRDECEVISGGGTIKQVHPGLFVLDL